MGLYRHAALFLTLLVLAPAVSAQGVPETLGRQIHPGQYFEPVSGRFFLHAVDTLGLIPAVFATADRITRSSLISRSGRSIVQPDGLLHEGVDAYRLHRRGRTSSSAASKEAAEVAYPDSGPMSAGADFEFLDYLISNELYRDAQTLMRATPYAHSDTLWYMRGRAELSNGEFAPAASAFGRVSPGAALYDKSFFYGIVSRARASRTQECADLLQRYNGPFAELAALQRAGVALLMDDKAAYDSASALFTHGDYALSEAQAAMEEIAGERFAAHHKSPALAAALSTILPGAGKIYAGRLGEGVSALLSVGALAAVTLNSAAKNGASDWKTIVPGTLCGIFYIGNIYGSYVSVSIVNDQKRKTQDAAILYNIHIPLHNVLR